jgi:hypothetical protein
MWWGFFIGRSGATVTPRSGFSRATQWRDNAGVQRRRPQMTEVGYLVEFVVNPDQQKIIY